MSDATLHQDLSHEASLKQLEEALFADLVVRQTNLARMFLGKVKDPQTGQATVDLEAAQMFIDQLEMLETKTRGNLSKPEEKFLKDSLTHLRMAFVEVSAHDPQPTPEKAAPAPAPADSAPPPTPAPTPAPATDQTAPATDADSRVRFSKKY